MYYSASDDAKLYIGTSTATPLPLPGVDSFTEVGLLRRLQPPPAEKTAGSFRVLNDKNPRSIGGRQVDQDYVGAVAIDRTDSGGTRMKQDAKAASAIYRNWRVENPDGSIESFVGFCTRYAPSGYDADAEPAPHEAEFTIRVDGEIVEG